MTPVNEGPGLPLRAAGEALGTALLVVVGPGAVVFDATHGGLGGLGIAIAFGTAVTLAVLVFGPLSGAHINPAVTIALTADGVVTPREAVAYLIAQLVGAVAGSAIVVALFGGAANAGATLPAISPAAALAAEAIMSGVLMLVILAARTGVGGALAGAVAIGGTVGMCAFVGGPFTGASLNPARSFGPAVVSGQWMAHWVYWVGPVGGTLFARIAYRAFARRRSPGVESRSPT